MFETRVIQFADGGESAIPVGGKTLDEVKVKGIEFFGKEHPLDIKSIKTGLRLSKWNPKMESWKDFRHNLVKEPA